MTNTGLKAFEVFKITLLKIHEDLMMPTAFLHILCVLTLPQVLKFEQSKYAYSQLNKCDDLLKWPRS